MDEDFLKAQVERCRTLADKADQFTKRRLLELADKYEIRLGKPSAATRILKAPVHLSDTPDRV